MIELDQTCHHRAHDVEVRIARIFNTYGPRMRHHDGRAVPTFIDHAFQGVKLTIHGDGSQTRSLCYVDDLVAGTRRLLESDLFGPVNLGNPEEVSVLELRRPCATLPARAQRFAFVDRPQDDPEMSCPDISLARSALGWEPTVSLREGVAKTVTWAKETWG